MAGSGVMVTEQRGRVASRPIGPLVKRSRELLGMSQARLAVALGVQQSYVSKIERGLVKLPMRDLVDRLAEVLGISVADIMSEAGVLVGVDDSRTAVWPVYAEDGDPRAGYTPREVAEIVAFVESRPGERFREQLADERRRRSRDSYERFCVSLFIAWGANAQLAFNASRENGS